MGVFFIWLAYEIFHTLNSDFVLPFLTWNLPLKTKKASKMEIKWNKKLEIEISRHPSFTFDSLAAPWITSVLFLKPNCPITLNRFNFDFPLTNIPTWAAIEFGCIWWKSFFKLRDKIMMFMSDSIFKEFRSRRWICFT